MVIPLADLGVGTTGARPHLRVQILLFLKLFFKKTPLRCWRHLQRKSWNSESTSGHKNTLPLLNTKLIFTRSCYWYSGLITPNIRLPATLYQIFALTNKRILLWHKHFLEAVLRQYHVLLFMNSLLCSIQNTLLLVFYGIIEAPRFALRF